MSNYKRVTIEAKGSNCGSIYDLADQHCDIEMSIPVDGYAVLVPSYYNREPIICDDLQEAAEAYADHQDYQGVTILNSSGDEVAVEYFSEINNYKIDGVEVWDND